MNYKTTYTSDNQYTLFLRRGTQNNGVIIFILLGTQIIRHQNNFYNLYVI